MLIEHKRPVLSSARIILDDELLRRAMRDKSYAYVTAISHHRFDFGPGVSVKPKKTIVVHLGGMTPEKLLQTFNETSRNEIRRTFSMADLAIRRDTNLDVAYDLYARFERAQGRTPQHKESFLKSRIWCAYLDGRIISAIACYDSKPILRVRAIYSTRLWEKDKNRYALTGFITRRLVYEICAYGIKNGYTGVDMGAANFKDSTKQGVTKFKSSFGGEVVDEYTYTYKSKLFRFIKLISRLLTK